MLSNFRDAGGLRTLDGGMMRAGMLFRSEELERATAAELARVEALGVRLVCDLRSPGERRPRKSAPVTLPVVNVVWHDPAVHDGNGRKVFGMMFRRDAEARFYGLFREYYQHLAFARAAELGKVVTLLAQDGSLPALVHCRAGKDRTGLAIALVQLLVGVPYATVRAEYLRTNDCFAERRERFIGWMRWLTLGQVPAGRMRLLLTAHGELLDEVHAAMVARHGSIEGYLREGCRVDGGALGVLRQRLLAE